MQTLTNHTALVTGSTSGIGRAIAGRLAEAGARVVVTGRRPDWGARTVTDIRAAGGTAEFFQADVTDGDALYALVEFAVKTFGGLDILVNNAGLIPRRPEGGSYDGALHTTEESYWDQLYQQSLKSVLRVTKNAIPHLLQSEHASVIHISSSLALQGFGVDIYSAIKGALVSLTRSMAVSYGHRIRVNCICPGTVLVERNRPLWDAHPELFEQAETSTLTRVGIPDDIAECAVYLASAPFVTGAIIPVDGGMTIRGYPLPAPAIKS